MFVLRLGLGSLVILPEATSDMGVIVRVSLCGPETLLSGFYVSNNPTGENLVEWDAGMVDLNIADIFDNPAAIGIIETLISFNDYQSIIKKVDGVHYGASDGHGHGSTGYSFRVDFEASNDIVLDIDGECMIGEEFSLYFYVDWTDGTLAYFVKYGARGAWSELGAEDASARFTVYGKTFSVWLAGRAATIGRFFDFMLGL